MEDALRSLDELYTVHGEPTPTPGGPVLVHAFAGFVDAGSGVRLAAEHVLTEYRHRLLVTFDADACIDYRARRPRMSFRMDHFAAVEMPQIAVHELLDSAGQPFLLLSGPEPDYQWQSFTQAVQDLTTRFRVRLAVGLSAIPWPAPHTRPIGLALHGSDRELIRGALPVVGDIEVPGHVGALLEYQLAQGGLSSMGVTAQVPHYLVQFDYPRAAQALIDGLARMTGLAFTSAGLHDAAARADGEVAEQLAGNEEFSSVLAALEQQYDQLMPAHAPAETVPAAAVPSADEIAAQVEAFLHGLSDPDASKEPESP